MALPARFAALHKAKVLVGSTIWDVNTDALPRLMRIGYVALRVLSIIRTDYERNKLSLKAAALTNITLMSIVPVLAFIVALAKGMGLYTRLMGPVEAALNDPNSELPRGVSEMALTLLQFIQKTDISALGPVAVLVTLWTIVSVIGSIETAFNSIWGIEQGRDLMTRFKDYLLLVFLLPVAFAVATSVTAAMKMESAQEFLAGYLGEAGLAISTIISLGVSILLLSLALTYMYRFLPNTRVRFLPAFMGALATTLVWLLMQRLYVRFQIGVASANSIYGAFATLPLFLTWLYISWLVTLLGGVLVYGLQCHRDYRLDDPQNEPAPGMVADTCVVVFGDIAEHFRRGMNWTMSDALSRLHLSNRVLRRAVFILERAKLIVATRELDNFVPTENTNRITLDDLHRAFSRDRLSPANLPDSHARALLATFQEEAALHTERLKAVKVTQD
jgi:membrane protein